MCIGVLHDAPISDIMCGSLNQCVPSILRYIFIYDWLLDNIY